MKIYDVGANQQVNATTVSATGWTVYQASGLAKISFVADSEQIVAAGETKTYELRGTLSTAGITGDTLQTKLADRGASATTTAYLVSAVDSVPASATLYSFIWTDRSGAAGTHSSITVDWTHDYKVSGIPTATLSLSR